MSFRPAGEIFSHSKIPPLLEQVCNLLRKVFFGSKKKRYGRGCKPRPALGVKKSGMDTNAIASITMAQSTRQQY